MRLSFHISFCRNATILHVKSEEVIAWCQDPLELQVKDIRMLALAIIRPRKISVLRMLSLNGLMASVCWLWKPLHNLSSLIRKPAFL